LSEAWLEDARGERIDNVEVGEPIRLRARIEARDDLESPTFRINFTNADGVQVFGLDHEMAGEILESGQQASVSATVENQLMPGRYTVVCWVAVTRNEEETAHQTLKLLEFVVFGVEGGPGLVKVPGDVGVEIEKSPAPEGTR
jgi:hypothetical protein